MASFLEELLPGIPDDVTLTHIAAKLPWTDFFSLAAVSKKWQQVIRGGEIYNERLRTNSSEELAIVKHLDSVDADGVKRNAISIYSTRKKAFHKLPAIPSRGYSLVCQVFAFQRRIFVWLHDWRISRTLSGENRFDDGKVKAYFFDLALQGQWQECPENPTRGTFRLFPTCEYAFRIPCRHNLTGPQTFLADGFPNRSATTWRVRVSPWLPLLAPEPPQVTPLENIPKMWPWTEARRRNPSSGVGDQNGMSSGLPRVAENSRLGGLGRKYWMIRGVPGVSHIYVKDSTTQGTAARKLWRRQHSITLDESNGRGEIVPALIQPVLIIPMDGELLSIARWDNPNLGYEFLQSRGFGSVSRKITWEIIPYGNPKPYDAYSFFSSCPVRL